MKGSAYWRVLAVRTLPTCSHTDAQARPPKSLENATFSRLADWFLFGRVIGPHAQGQGQERKIAFLIHGAGCRGAALGRAADVCSWSVVWQRRDMLGFVLAGEDREPDEVQHPRLWRGCRPFAVRKYRIANKARPHAQGRGLQSIIRVFTNSAPPARAREYVFLENSSIF